MRDRDTMDQERVPIAHLVADVRTAPRSPGVDVPDYYEMLGVDEDAPVDDIRAAYRDKRAAATAVNEKSKDKGGDAERARAEAAALNKAWNVLSDPYQRGRYDQERASDAADSDDDDADDDDDDDDATTPRGARAAKTDPKLSRANQKRAERAALVPTVTLPPGVGFPSTRRRLTAMFIDLAVLLALFIGSQVLVVHLEKSNHPAAYKQNTAARTRALEARASRRRRRPKAPQRRSRRRRRSTRTRRPR